MERVEVKSYNTFVNMNKPVILFGLTGSQIMIVGVIVAMSFIIDLYLGAILMVPISILLGRVIAENKKGNIKYIKSLTRYKKLYLKDKSDLLKYL